MRKLIIIVVSILLVVLLAVVAISVVIIENDMASCTEPAGDVCAKADAIVVVSGGDTFARTDKAVEMYQQGWSDKLIFSGASADPDSISNAEAMRRVATAQGVPDGDIYLDEHSKDTRENAKNTVEILHQLGAKNVILVSSPYHLRRVKMNFMAVDDMISYRTMAAHDDNWDWWFIKPSGWIIATKELAGIAELSAEVK